MQLIAKQEYMEQCLKDCLNKLVDYELVEDVFDLIGVVNKELMV